MIIDYTEPYTIRHITVINFWNYGLILNNLTEEVYKTIFNSLILSRRRGITSKNMREGVKKSVSHIVKDILKGED